VRATGLPPRTALEEERGGRAGKQGKFRLFNSRHPGKVTDTSQGMRNP